MNSRKINAPIRIQNNEVIHRRMSCTRESIHDIINARQSVDNNEKSGNKPAHRRSKSDTNNINDKTTSISDVHRDKSH